MTSILADRWVKLFKQAEGLDHLLVGPQSKGQVCISSVSYAPLVEDCRDCAEDLLYLMTAESLNVEHPFSAWQIDFSSCPFGRAGSFGKESTFRRPTNDIESLPIARCTCTRGQPGLTLWRIRIGSEMITDKKRRVNMYNNHYVRSVKQLIKSQGPLNLPWSTLTSLLRLQDAEDDKPRASARAKGVQVTC